MKKSFLSGLSHTEFLRRHWQKIPLLARGALRQYTGAIKREELFELAGVEDIDSRIVIRTGGRWRVRHGPFSRRDIARLPHSGWTLLVQGVDRVLPRAARLLHEFSFIPYARLDDVMVSYATPGGGVGPHFDSYDVFLVQGEGQRRWQISSQRDLELVPDVPLKILRSFRREHEWVLEPGDLLYLPPQCAHHGVALVECITYSIGFRAPQAQELGAHFLEFLQDRVELEGTYTDPNLTPARRPARIPSAMVMHTARMLENLRWSRATVADFLGRYLTEPKDQVIFDRPRRALGAGEFGLRAGRNGLRLAQNTRMLFYGRKAFINGEACLPGSAALRVLTGLADARRLPGSTSLNAEARRLLYGWYRAGYIELGSTSRLRHEP